MEQKVRQIPYGVTNFEEIRRENKYYVDKTMYIPKLEYAGNFLMFLRPRRFGKSLLLAVLADYYDVKREDKFDELFSGLYIHENPTEKRNKYLILSLNFSKVDPQDVETSFNDYLLEMFGNFVQKYQEYLPNLNYDDFKQIKSSNTAFTRLDNAVSLTDWKIYVIIDEYDNFANTLLAESENDYLKLTHGTGKFRLFFNNLKACTTGSGSSVSRIFISGVTPLCLSDVTSGFNIGRNISLEEDFNSMVGFTDSDIRQMFEYYRDATGVFKHSIDELMDVTKPWYDNNCFNENCLGEHMYNSDMTLYFLNMYSQKGCFPKEMVDTNVKTDYNKMVKIIRFEKTFGDKTRTIQKVANNGEIFSIINTEFALADLQSYRNLVSLMFYMGLLSIGRYEMGTPVLIVPNNTVRQQYIDYMLHVYEQILDWRSDISELNDLGRGMAWLGEAEPMFRYVADCMKDQSSNRDFDKYGEAFVKGFMQCQFGAYLSYFTSFTEKELGHGYSDIYLEPRNGAMHSYVVELKYLKHQSSEEEVEAKLNEARTQIEKYVSDKRYKVIAKEKNWILHKIILVFKGWEMARYEEK